MRVTRVFVEQKLISGKGVGLPDQAGLHLTRVLRLEPGAVVSLFDGTGGEYEGTLERDGKKIWARVGAHSAIERESSLQVTLIQGVARGERMDLIVQKATELGVTAIRPIHTQYSGVKLDETQAARKVAHWRAVAVGASEQSGRDRVPEILAPLPLDRALVEAPTGSKLLLSTGSDDSPAPPLSRSQFSPGNDWITLLVGPEGGFAQSEEAIARHAGFVAIGLGPRVLRTETAGPTALAAIGAMVGDLARD